MTKLEVTAKFDSEELSTKIVKKWDMVFLYFDDDTTMSSGVYDMCVKHPEIVLHLNYKSWE